MRLIIVSISGLAAACLRVCRSGSTPDSARVFWSAISRMRASAFSATQSAVGDTQSSWASLACLKNAGAWPSIRSSTIGKAPAFTTSSYTASASGSDAISPWITHTSPSCTAAE